MKHSRTGPTSVNKKQTPGPTSVNKKQTPGPTSVNKKQTQFTICITSKYIFKCTYECTLSSNWSSTSAAWPMMYLGGQQPAVRNQESSQSPLGCRWSLSW